MKRNILPMFAALAFALPFITAQTTSAAEPRWGGAQQGYEQTWEPGGGDDVSLELTIGFCSAVQVLAVDRACGVLAADQCLAACNEAAVEPYCGATLGDRAACIDDTVRSCRSACAGEGATFCDARWSGGKQPAIPGKHPVIPGKNPVIPGKNPVIPGKLPAFPDQQQATPDQLPAFPDQLPAFPDQLPAFPGQQAYPDQMPAFPGQQAYPDQMPAYPDQAPAKRGGGDSGVIFVSVEECTSLGLEINVEK